MNKGSKMTEKQKQTIRDGIKKKQLEGHTVWNKGKTQKTDSRLNYHRPTQIKPGQCGEKSLAWQGGKCDWIRQVMFQNRNNKCELCEETRDKFLVIHHKDLMGTIYEAKGILDFENNRQNNLQILCRKHHTRLHNDIRNSTALVLYSGGQDSTTCLIWAKQTFKNVIALSFDYQSKHSIELEQSKIICEILNIERKIVDVSFINDITENALTRKQISIETPNGKLPSTFVAGRNLLFLSIAGSIAYTNNIQHLITGVCQTDYSGYPDCRHEFICSVNKTLNSSMDKKFTIHTPLMWLTKAQTVLLMKKLGGINLLKYSHTCYEGKRPACGKCPACKLRLKGFKEAGTKDPIEYEV